MWARLTAFTEHFHGPDQNMRYLTLSLSRNSLWRSPVTLAAAKGIANGDYVKVSSKRGFIRAVAVVTRRLRTLQVHAQRSAG